VLPVAIEKMPEDALWTERLKSMGDRGSAFARDCKIDNVV
jgi:hypothetical protein